MPELVNHRRIANLVRSGQHREHGTRARYMSGCRCLPCRAANSRYSCMRQAEVDAGRTNRLVSSEKARAHIEDLGRAGVGYKSIAIAAGVATSIVAQIKSGARLNIREETERRVLAVDDQARSAASLVPARDAWRKLDALIALGYTKQQLAEWMGLKHSIQFRRDVITWKNHVRVDKLCRMIEAGRLRRER